MLHTVLVRCEEWTDVKCYRMWGIGREWFGQKLCHRSGLSNSIYKLS